MLPIKPVYLVFSDETLDSAFMDKPLALSHLGRLKLYTSGDCYFEKELLSSSEIDEVLKKGPVLPAYLVNKL